MLDCLLHSCLECRVHESNIPTCSRYLNVELLRSDIREDGWTKQQTFPSAGSDFKVQVSADIHFPALTSSKKKHC